MATNRPISPYVPQVTPFALMKALAEARRRGPRGDPYGLSTAFKSVNESLESMRKAQIQEMNIRKQEMEMGQMPAVLAQRAAQLRLQQAQSERDYAKIQDIQQASAKAALLHNKDAFDFPLYIMQNLQTAEAREEFRKAIPAIQKEMENRENKISLMREGMQKYEYDKRYQEELSRRSIGEFKGPNAEKERAAAIAKRENDARAEARRHMDDIEINVDINPVTGKISVKDRWGNLRAPPSALQNVVDAVGGNKTFFDIQKQIQTTDWATGGKAIADLQRDKARQDLIGMWKLKAGGMKRDVAELELKEAIDKREQYERSIVPLHKGGEPLPDGVQQHIKDLDANVEIARRIVDFHRQQPEAVPGTVGGPRSAGPPPPVTSGGGDGSVTPQYGGGPPVNMSVVPESYSDPNKPGYVAPAPKTTAEAQAILDAKIAAEKGGPSPNQGGSFLDQFRNIFSSANAAPVNPARPIPRGPVSALPELPTDYYGNKSFEYELPAFMQGWGEDWARIKEMQGLE